MLTGTAQQRQRANLENQTMLANSVVRTRVDEHIKEEALPFEPPEPHVTTVDAMKEARQGDLKSFYSVEDLMADLNTER